MQSELDLQPNKNILLISPTNDLGITLSDYLNKKEINILTAKNAQGARIRIEAWTIDIFIIDKGIERSELRKILPSVILKRRTHKIIAITDVQIEDRMHWISIGVDDIIVSPFHPAELANKIELLIYPMNSLRDERELQRGYYQLDTYENSLMINGFKVYLSNKELILVHYFMTTEGLRSIQDIGKMFGSKGYPTDENSVRVAITLLKNKIRKQTSYEMIRCRRGLGFYLLGV